MKRIYLYPGQLSASADPAEITTLLGSCVAVALFDPKTQMGGLNHYLLPEAPAGEETNPRYGSAAIALLRESLRQLGASPQRLQAKIYGGSRSLGDASRTQRVGELNCRFARQELARLRIPILLEDVGGDGGMKIALQTHTFSVDARRMREQAAPDVTLARGTRVIAVVGNMGSQLSLVAFLERLGRDAPPVVVSGAIPGTRLLKGRPEWGMSWRIAENRELLENGKVYFAPEGSATEVGSSGSDGAFQVAIHHHRKLENHELNGCLIQSLSRGLASSAAVVLLGGKMDSGAEAFVEFSKQGAFTVVESPDSAAFSELPSFVVNLGAATRVLPAGKIAEAFGVLTRRRAA